MIKFYQYFPYLMCIPILLFLVFGFQLKKHLDYQFQISKIISKIKKTLYQKFKAKNTSDSNLNSNSDNKISQRQIQQNNQNLSASSDSQLSFKHKNSLDFDIYIRASKISKDFILQSNNKSQRGQQTLEPRPTIDRNYLGIRKISKKINKKSMIQQSTEVKQQEQTKIRTIRDLIKQKIEK